MVKYNYNNINNDIMSVWPFCTPIASYYDLIITVIILYIIKIKFSAHSNVLNLIVILKLTTIIRMMYFSINCLI